MKIDIFAMFSIAVSLCALLSATTHQPVLFVPMSLVALRLALSAANRKSTVAIAPRGIRRAALVAAVFVCVVSSIAGLAIWTDARNRQNALSTDQSDRTVNSFESSADPDPPVVSSEGTARTLESDAAFCEMVGPFVNKAIDFEVAARSGDYSRFQKAMGRLFSASERWTNEQDKFSDVSAYTDAFGTYNFYLDQVAMASTLGQWNQLRRRTGSHLTKGLVLRTSYTCPDYAAVRGL